jgi:peptidoglycan/LPS O-acetylase OafA/YrhL
VERLSSESRNLDLLRTVAVSCVFGAHLVLSLISSPYPQSHSEWIPELYELGRVGVQIFFVHTSLVLLLSLDRNPSQTLFRNFYIRRFFRIYPLSTACILIVLLLGIPNIPRDSFLAPGWRGILSNLLLIQNLTGAKDLISPLWSLPLEVQMYVLLPVIFVVLRKFGSGPLVLGMWTMAFAAVRLSPLLAFFPCFFGGVFAYQLSKEKPFRAPAALWPAALALLLMVHAWFRHAIAADVRSDFVMCMFLGGLIPNFRDLGPSWLTTTCHVIARYSYGIYLFHLPIIWLAFFKFITLPLALRWALFCILMWAVPWVAYHWLEAPMIMLGRRLAARWSGAVSALQRERAPAETALS